MRGGEHVPESGVFAIRHAPTVASLAEAAICVGDADVPCVMSAEKAAAVMRTLLADCRFAGVWSSPLSRCHHPARVLAGQLGVPLHVDQRVREICLGTWQGQTWSTIEANDAQRFAAWTSNWTETAPPGGETAADLLLRLRSWWNDLPHGRHLLVAHAGVVRGLRVMISGESWVQAMREPVANLQGAWFAKPKAGADA
jgi:alpha-ribazole phosphatase